MNGIICRHSNGDDKCMDTEKVTLDLNKRFAAPLPDYYKRRIIFWYDEEREFEDRLDEIQLSNASIIRMTGRNTFAVKKLLSHGLYNKNKARAASMEYIKKLNIKTPSGDQITGNLSGGNQQKIVIAKWLLNDPDIIILDEPTRGIDVGAKRDIYLLLGKLVQQGKAVIMISSEIPELMGVCDRIMVMCEGNLSGEVQRDAFSQERIMTLASAIEV